MKTENNNSTVLSVRLMTYNHGDFIEEALRGIDIQQTNFRFEVVVGDDFSTDNTLSKIREYNFINPNLDLIILEREIGGNYYKERKRQGRLYNFINILNNCNGKYIALLDGDDYWTDSLKLQKQVDFLETNKNFGICFHKVQQFNCFSSEVSFIPGIDKNTVYNIDDYILSNKTATCSMLFRKEKLGVIPEWFTKLPFGDLGLILIILKNSNKKGMVLKDNMAVYRIHEGGINGSLLKNENLYIQTYKKHLQFLHIVKKNLFNKEHEITILKSYIFIYKELLRLNPKNKSDFMLRLSHQWYSYRLKLSRKRRSLNWI